MTTYYRRPETVNAFQCPKGLTEEDYEIASEIADIVDGEVFTSLTGLLITVSPVRRRDVGVLLPGDWLILHISTATGGYSILTDTAFHRDYVKGDG